MSEAASASPASSSTSTSTSATQTSAPAKAQGAEGQASEAPQEFEDVRVGGISGKVPKALAKTIKELERGFQSKAQESAGYKRQLDGLEAEAQANPNAFVRKYKIDPVAFSEATLSEKLRMMSMSPEQRKAWEMEQENTTLKETLKEREERETSEKQEQAEAQEYQNITQELVKVWKDSGLPANAKFGQWITATYLQAQNQNLGWTWEQCASKVKTDWVNHVQEVSATLDPEKLEEFFGQGALKKWRDYDVKRVTQKGASQPSQANRPGAQPASKSNSNRPKGSMTEAEYRDYMDNLKEGLKSS